MRRGILLVVAVSFTPKRERDLSSDVCARFGKTLSSFSTSFDTSCLGFQINISNQFENIKIQQKLIYGILLAPDVDAFTELGLPKPIGFMIHHPIFMKFVVAVFCVVFVCFGGFQAG
jgi:hypothetical protein